MEGSEYIKHLGILVGPPKIMGQSEVDARPDCMISGDYHKMVKKRFWGNSGPARYYHGLGMTREMAFRASTRCPRYPYTRIVAAQLDPEEGVRTIRYGPYANLGSA